MFDEDITKRLKEKLIVLYVLNESNYPMSMGELEDVLLPTDLINILSLVETLEELISSALVEHISGKYDLYKISDEGKETILIFDEKINEFHREKLNRQVGLFKREKKNKNFINASYSKIKEDASIVKMTINEGDSSLIELTIRVPSNEHAEKMVKRWKRNAVDIFQGIVKLFEDEKKTDD